MPGKRLSVMGPTHIRHGLSKAHLNTKKLPRQNKSHSCHISFHPKAPLCLWLKFRSLWPLPGQSKEGPPATSTPPSFPSPRANSIVFFLLASTCCLLPSLQCFIDCPTLLSLTDLKHSPRMYWVHHLDSLYFSWGQENLASTSLCVLNKLKW